MARPFASVIVATYMREDLLRNTITDILAQDYAPMEVIIIDQSPSHDPPTLEFLEQVRPLLAYYALPTPNLPAARNLGIRMSRGTVLIFFDDDVALTPWTVSRAVSVLTREYVGGITGPCTTLIQIRSEQAPKPCSNHGDLATVSYLPGYFMALRREAVEAVGGFDEWIGTHLTAAGEDVDFGRRVSAAGFVLYEDSQNPICHVGASRAAGGCQKGIAPSEVVYYQQMKLFLYCCLKTRRFPGVIGVLDAIWAGYHGYIFNRTELFRRWRQLPANHRLFARALTEAVRDVKSFRRRANAQPCDETAT